MDGLGLSLGNLTSITPADLKRREGDRSLPDIVAPFHDRFAELFDAEFRRVFRYLDRLSGDGELAADLTQEAFVRLYRRGSMPDAPVAWLITVARNLFRNEKSTRTRRRQLLTVARGEGVLGNPPRSPDEEVQGEESRRRVRIAIDQLPERERSLLLLRAEGYSYRDLATALGLNEASIGTLLARAKAAFRTSYEGTFDAP